MGFSFKDLIKLDGWKNLLSGKGVFGRDKTEHTQVGDIHILTVDEIDRIFRANGFGRKIIRLPVAYMFKEGWIIKGTDKIYIFKEVYQKLDLINKLVEAFTWERAFGGSLLVFGVNDGQDLIKPLNKNNIRSFDFIRVYDKTEVSFSEIYLDDKNPQYGQPKIYQISGTVGDSYSVHESRCYRLCGDLIPNRTRRGMNGWGESVLQQVFTELKQLGSAYKDIETIIDDFITAMLSIEGLADLIANDEDDKIKKRLEILDLSKHMINTMIIDKEETYEKKSSSVAGLAELLREFQIALCAVSNVPSTLMLGRSPAGMNATGESDLSNWYDDMSFEQILKLLPLLNHIHNLMMLCQDMGFNKTIDKKVEVKFNSLWQPSDKEISETEKNKADTAKTYVEIGAIVSEEVRNTLKTEGIFEIDDSNDLSLEDFQDPNKDPNKEPDKNKDPEKDKK